ncbi:hypothetical protein HWV00_11500 [Moritella sp. 24]|uniref:complement resistance protein TraT n=1 Tax=Moritella sp. 24 TaxID=2746230 RepID=UPI001BA9098A|nr:complement resistance protein TraT [Moritella sp. 24]QUM76809.1 hypothetical protein HWV00_11500 [Moritella sp. 24]
MKSLRVLMLGVFFTSLIGCSAITTVIKKQDLVVDAKLSHSVILEPMMLSDRIVYAQVRDMSGNSLRKSFQKALEKELALEGIQVTKDPKAANLMLNATIIQAGKTTAEDANQALSAGVQSALAGGAIAGLAGQNFATAAAIGLAAGAVGFVADSLIEDTYYSFVMDVQLRERPLEGDSISNAIDNSTNKSTAVSNSKSSSTVQRGQNYNWIVHDSRIVSTANQMNLTLEEAMPLVTTKTVSSLTNMML